MTKWVYTFGDGNAEGSADMRDLLGGKGANLAEMSRLELPVPPGFTLTTEVCTYYSEHKGNFPRGLKARVEEALAGIEKVMGAKLGNTKNPLLVSVRSGARASMPGMMDTVLNLGLNERTVEGLAANSGDERFAYDSYRRFIQMYANVVMGMEHFHFEDLLEDHKLAHGQNLDTDLDASDWKALIGEYMEKIEEVLGKPFPRDPKEQLWGAIGAVFSSWQNERAVIYRKLYDIPDEWGTAVNIQAMVFGNMGPDSATGVCFTRDPSTGENVFYGEFLINAQGEDVVAGIRTPRPLTIAGREAGDDDQESMEEAMPGPFAELVVVRGRLEKHYRDTQDMEFTIQRGKLWMLQTRTGKRSTRAAVKIAVDMVAEGLIDKAEAVRRVDADQLDQLLHPTRDPEAERHVIAKGLPASPGAASGMVVFTAEAAEVRGALHEKVILVRAETSPEDIGGMHAAQGILTTRGGTTCHAALVARGMGKPCVTGAGEVRVNVDAKTLTTGRMVLGEGEVITIDGSTGEVMLGAVPTIEPELSGDFATLMEWVDGFRTMKVRANAETPTDAETARRFGAEGIGLCRTEHMFFDLERIVHMREMILAEDEPRRRTALAKLLPYQRRDFVELFNIMAGLPVTVRLLDPPLHEFLPHDEGDLEDVAREAGIDLASVKARAAKLKETNPMLGHRGCRLGVTYPEIYEMQVRAIFEAAAEVMRDGGGAVVPEVMVPLVGSRRELDLIKKLVDVVAAEVAAASGVEIDYLVGTMIELPRAALRAHDIARVAEFFSFGTNDLTQATFGLSRDDAGTFLKVYHEKGVFRDDPFVTLDVRGVGELIRIATQRGRGRKPDLKLGICGEHGGDPASIRFCHGVGLDYVSCSPYRVPIARLAAAQAALAEKE
jgi:pyruvate, orthophosphate dikinase